MTTRETTAGPDPVTASEAVAGKGAGRRGFGNAGPVLIVLVVCLLLGYPLALLFGLPLARRDMQDLRKWEVETVTARPLERVPTDLELTFAAPAVQLPGRDDPGQIAGGILVKDELPVDWDYELSEDGGVVLASAPPEPAVEWLGQLEPLGDGLYRLPEGVDASDPALALYVGDTLAVGGTSPAREVPDGQRTVFTFPGAGGPVILAGRVLASEEYEWQGEELVLDTPPAFRADLRRVTGDFGVVDPSAGLVVFATMPEQPVRVADVVRLAEVLQPVGSDGSRYRFANERVVETDRTRRVFLGDALLSGDPQRPAERVDGTTRVFTFPEPKGIITVDDVRVYEGRDYLREGNTVEFVAPPARNSRLRQYSDYFLVDPAAGEIELAEPAGSEPLWTSRYAVYARPGCGESVLECFFALPQHPVPFPNWIAERIGPFVGKYPLADERNVIRATLYTTVGTLAALLLGSVVGTVLAIMFVLLRPLERALLPWVIASQTIPIIALVPVLLLVLGNFGITIQTSILPTAIVGAYIAFFPMVVGTVKGLRSVDPLSLDLMRSYAATPLQVFMKLRFPAATPFFFTSLKLATASALVGALVAETESNNSRGLGYQILGQVQSGNVADVWILLIISALLGIGLVALVGLLQRVLAPWERA